MGKGIEQHDKTEGKIHYANDFKNYEKHGFDFKLNYVVTIRRQFKMVLEQEVPSYTLVCPNLLIIVNA